MLAWSIFLLWLACALAGLWWVDPRRGSIAAWCGLS